MAIKHIEVFDNLSPEVKAKLLNEVRNIKQAVTTMRGMISDTDLNLMGEVTRAIGTKFMSKLTRLAMFGEAEDYEKLGSVFLDILADSKFLQEVSQIILKDD
jgi:hypothetical protein